MARYIRKIVEDAVDDDLVILTELLGRIRPFITFRNSSSDENKKIFNSFIEERFISAIKKRDVDYIKIRLRSVLKEISEEKITELLNDLW